MTTRAIHLRAKKRASQRGLSIVEFMVGTAIGLFVVGGALKVFVDLFDNNRRQLVEVRLNQDLRAAADIISRDLRRSGYWENATLGVAQTPVDNPFANANVTGMTANSLTYTYDRSRDGAFAAVTDQSGFQLTGYVLQMRVGNGWQNLTDPATVQVTSFTVDTSAGAEQVVSRAAYCPCVSSAGPTRCDPAVVDASANRPVVVMRRANIEIQGRATTDNTMTRQVVETVRLRNDEVRGVCPPA
jgi:type IV pilus assembly protein PilW